MDQRGSGRTGITSIVFPCSLDALPQFGSLQPALIVMEVQPGDRATGELLRCLASTAEPVFRNTRILLISGDIETSGIGSFEGVSRSATRHPGNPANRP